MVIELCWAFVALEISSCLVIAKNLIFSPPGSHNSRPCDPSSEENLRPSLRYLRWLIPKVAVCFYVGILTRFSQFGYL